VTLHTIRRDLAGTRLDIATAIAIARPSAWVLLALALIFLAYRLLAEHLQRRTLLAILDRAAAGCVLSLDDALGVCGMRVIVGSPLATAPEKADRGPTADPE
jgi:hypothetical protein